MSVESIDAGATITDQAPGRRECGSCQACCQGWLTADILGQRIQPGVPCANLCDAGCGIYAERPENPCRQFRCAWLRGDADLPEDLRPDRSGVIVISDRPWQGWQVLRLVPTGETVPPAALETLQAVARRDGIPLIISVNGRQDDGSYRRLKDVGYGPPAFAQAVQKAFKPEDVFMAPNEDSPPS